MDVGANVDPLGWYRDIPPVSRAYLTAVFVVTVLVTLDALSPFDLYYNQSLILEGQVSTRCSARQRTVRARSRSVSAPPLPPPRTRRRSGGSPRASCSSASSAFTSSCTCSSREPQAARQRLPRLGIRRARPTPSPGRPARAPRSMQQSISLEQGFGGVGGSADFVFFLLIAVVLLLCCAPFVPVLFFSPALMQVIVYVWSKRNPNVRMALFGVVPFSGAWLPYVLVAFSLAFGEAPSTHRGAARVNTAPGRTAIRYLWGPARRSSGPPASRCPPLPASPFRPQARTCRQS